MDSYRIEKIVVVKIYFTIYTKKQTNKQKNKEKEKENKLMLRFT